MRSSPKGRKDPKSPGLLDRIKERLAEYSIRWFTPIGDKALDYILKADSGYLTEKGRVWFHNVRFSIRYGRKEVGTWEVSPVSGKEYWKLMDQAEVGRRLKMKEPNVRRAHAALEQEGMHTSQAKALIPLFNPHPVRSEKLSPTITFPTEDPLFSTLQSLKTDLDRILQELREAEKAARRPVREQYHPVIRQIKTQMKKITKVLEERSADGQEGATKEVIVHDNFSELSPLDPKTGVIVHDKEKLSRTIAPSLLNKRITKEAQKPSSSSLSLLLQALRQWVPTADDDDARKLDPLHTEQGVPVEEIVQVINDKGPGVQSQDVKRPGAYLVKCVLNCFAGEAGKQRQAERQVALHVAQPVRPSVAELHMRDTMENILRDPNAPEEDKQAAREALAEMPAPRGPARQLAAEDPAERMGRR